MISAIGIACFSKVPKAGLDFYFLFLFGRQVSNLAGIQKVFSNFEQQICWFKISVSRNMFCTLFEKKGVCFVHP
jgi:hypothetical protein